MKRKWLMRSALSVMLSSMAAGQAQAAPTLRVQVEQKGDFLLIGNTQGHECAAGTPAPIVGTVGNCGSNTGDTSPDIYWRSEAPGAGQAQANNTITVAQSRSTAVLSIPPGATVTHAFLYWGANVPGGDNTVTLDRPGGFSQNLTALNVYTSTNNSYQGVADVTSLVQANGSGAYRVSGVNSTTVVDANGNVAFTGWWMVVLYQLTTDTPRNLAIFEGLDAVSNGAPQNTMISGFLVPPAFSNVKLGVVTFEGDSTISGDSFFFGPAPALSNALNPVDNFFNGTRSFLGAGVSNVGDLPQLTGTPQSMSGIDIDVVDITSKLTAGQTSAPISATSTGDQYYLAGFVTSIPTFKPDFGTSEKSAADLNGGSLLPGDTIEYTIVATNTGNDTSINSVMSDALPTGVTYVPGSMAITAGVNAGAKTDAVGDDQCEYVLATRMVVCRLGTGANGTQGGQMIVGQSSTVKFHVTIDAGVSGTINNQAVINASGLLGAPPESTPTDGNGAGNGQPPTPVVVDQCATDAQCAAPQPYCNVAATPNKCVQCLQDAQCPSNLPTCNAMTNTCTCVPSGAELCDGIDNDCDGAVDEGFNVGMPCSVGVGACAASGMTICLNATTATCSAVPLMPMAEICDGVDNDCDGMVDDGNPGGGVSCMSGLPGVCSSGSTNCAAGGMLTCVATIMPGQQAETCNGSDDDCDGMVDDGFNVGSSCSVGVGACANTGMIVCTGPNASMCNVTAGMPQTEACNDNIDNDCDGTVDENCLDSDGDGIPDVVEIQFGTDPNDADSDDDGVIDGNEQNWNQDSDGDGLINALDSDSDNDGLFDGTEMGLDCSNPATNPNAGQCIPDADMGATTTDPLDADTDNGGVPDGSEDFNKNGQIDPGEGNPNNPADDSMILDTDGDGLSDAFETQIGTDPFDADSDDDGVPDGQEPNPAADSDGDGLINAVDSDSDNDGLFDGTEMGFDCSNPATDPTQMSCIPDADMGATTTSPIDPDTDDGGISDGSEDFNKNGQIDPGEGNPNDPSDDSTITDTDGDGLSDAFEMQIGSDPNDADSDDDGVPDGQEANPAADTDGDGLINVLDSDSDDDGLFDGTELGFGCSNPATDPMQMSCIPDADMGATTTSPLDPDTDHGGVPDGTEDANHNGIIDPGEGDPNDPADDMVDTDGDGLTDAFEMQIGTDPNDADSDDDGVPDGQEVDPGADTDGDGLIDALDSDSDNDGLFDGTEMGFDCSNPATDTSQNHCIPDADMGATTTDPLDSDTDNGGVSDGSEDFNKNGVIDSGEGNPNDPADDATIIDTDGDGLSDGLEMQLGTNPNDADSDDDGVPDGQETNPAEDTDGDGIINALDFDSDDDSLFDGTEMGLDCSNAATDASKNHCIPDADKGATTTNPLDPDTDQGGVRDGVEDANHNGLIDEGETDPNNVADDNAAPTKFSVTGSCVCTTTSTNTNEMPVGFGLAIVAACAAVVRRSKRR